MRATSICAAMPIFAAMLVGCESSTGLSGCNLPAETASVTPIAPSYSGVIQRLKVGGTGNTPGGYDPWTQVDAFISIPVDNGSAHVTVDIVLGKGTPVLLQLSGGAPTTSVSACRLDVGDRVTVYAPLQGVTAGGFVGPSGDTTSLRDAAFLAELLIIDRGN